MTLKEKSKLTDEEKVGDTPWNVIAGGAAIYAVTAVFALIYLFNHRNTLDYSVNVALASFVVFTPIFLWIASVLCGPVEGENKWNCLDGVNFLLMISGFILVCISLSGGANVPIKEHYATEHHVNQDDLTVNKMTDERSRGLGVKKECNARGARCYDILNKQDKTTTNVIIHISSGKVESMETLK